MALKRTHYSSGTPWEPIVGYSRALRAGEQIWVSGTTATDATGELVGVGDPAAQARQALSNVETALRALGGELRHVVRTRMYVTDIAFWEDVAKVHGEVFGSVRPATSLVAVTGFVHPDMLVEVEAVAVVGE